MPVTMKGYGVGTMGSFKKFRSWTIHNSKFCCFDVNGLVLDAQSFPTRMIISS